MRAGAGVIDRWISGIVAAILLTLVNGTVLAQQRGPLAPPDASSPQAAVASFLALAGELEQVYSDYRADQDRRGARRLTDLLDRLRGMFDLRQVPPALRLKVGGEAVTSLMDVLSRLPAIDLAAIPGAAVSDPSRAPAHWVLPTTEISLVRLTDGPRQGSYVFSADTVERLPSFRERIIDHPLVRPSRFASMRDEQVRFTGPWIPVGLVEGLPDVLQATFFGTPRWKVVLAVAGLALVVAANLFWLRLVRRIGVGLSPVPRLLLRLTMPMLLALGFLALHVTVNYQINIQGRIAEIEFVVFSIACYAAAAWMAWIGAFLIVEWVIASPHVPDASYDAQLLRLLGQLLALVGAGVIVVYGANEVGIPALGLFAGLGVGSLAVALAAKPTVENLFGGVTLFADRPFRVGDRISYGTTSGTVESVGPRSSRIRGLDGTLTTVPNADLAQAQITNASNWTKGHFLHSFGLPHGSSPAQVDRLLESLRERLLAHPAVERDGDLPRVRIVGFGPGSIKVEVRAHVLAADVGRFLEVQEQLILDLMRTVHEAGMTLAPTA